jgi:hypothetical protein
MGVTRIFVGRSLGSVMSGDDFAQGMMTPIGGVVAVTTFSPRRTLSGRRLSNGGERDRVVTLGFLGAAGNVTTLEVGSHLFQDRATTAPGTQRASTRSFRLSTRAERGVESLHPHPGFGNGRLESRLWASAGEDESDREIVEQAIRWERSKDRFSEPYSCTSLQ